MRATYTRRFAAAAIAVMVGGLVTAGGSSQAAAVRHSAPRGRLLSASPMTAYLLPGIPIPAKAWRIRYTSTTATGRQTIVSGTVLVPTVAARTAPRPLVGFAVGTQGLADRCAPSHTLTTGEEFESATINDLLKQGWAVTVTDYPGLGTPGQHTYTMGNALGRSVLDSIRAARQLRAAHLSRRGPAAVMGYSEGGGAAGWAAQLQPTYSPHLDLVGAAIGGVPANLQIVLRHNDGGPFSFLVPYAVVGMRAEYEGSDTGHDLTRHGRNVIRALEQTCLQDASNHYPPLTKLSSLTKSNLFAVPRVRHILAINRLGRRAPAVPVLIQQSPNDEIVPFRQVATLHRQWRREGARVTLRKLSAPDHISGSTLYVPAALTWLRNRFAAASSGVRKTV
ncbi:MAG: hypothetical protein QOK12_1388 [Mycobacterium sp.]|nr:hypothetical protein [Mycobacterium sp.]